MRFTFIFIKPLRRFRAIRDEEGEIRDSPWGPVQLPVISITCVLTRFFTRPAERRFFEVFRDLVDDFDFHHANNHGDYVHEDPTALRHLIPPRLREAIYGRLREPCMFPWDALYLLSDGTMSVCRFDFDARIGVGRYPESSIPELWNSEAMRDLRRAHLAFDYVGWEQCRACSAAKYGNRAEHHAITRKIMKRNGFPIRHDVWLPVDPRKLAPGNSDAELELTARSHGFDHGKRR